MKVKKTWFSYVLWLLATGFSILVTYYALTNAVKYMEIRESDRIGLSVAYTAATVVFTVAIGFFLRWLGSKVPPLRLNKWFSRGLFCLVLLGVTCLFWFVRAQVLTFAEGSMEQLYCFFQLSDAPFTTQYGETFIMEILYPEQMEKVGQMLNGVTLTVFEKSYTAFIAILFLFFGDMSGFIYIASKVLQVLTLFLLVFIGFKMQKGILAWIPALTYTFLPLYAYMYEDYGPSNFAFYFLLLGIALIWLNQKSGADKTRSCVLTAIWGSFVCIFVCMTKSAVLFKHVHPFVSGGVFVSNEFLFYIELLGGALLLLLYCMGYGFAKKNVCLIYFIPLALVTGSFWALRDKENDVTLFLSAFLILWILFLGMEGLRLLFSYPQTISEKDSDCQKTPVLQENITCEETTACTEDIGLIRVSDILGTANKADADEVVEEVTDKSAMIENVLPMPKKHVSRNLDYSFDPSEDMMHYDVEIENDDYDYR